MVVWWGKDFRLLYNDAFRSVLGDRHPQALGLTAQSVFPESWHIIGPQLNSIFETRIAQREEDILIPALRIGYLEECYYTYSYSPLLTETGEVEGVFTVINETTKRILIERRLAISTQLAAQAGAAQTGEALYQKIAATLSQNPADLPFAALYRLNPAKSQAILCARTPADIKDLPLPDLINFDHADPWQFETAIHTRSALTVNNLFTRVEAVPSGPFDLPVNKARVLPIWALGLRSIVGLLVVGLNPARRLDESYTSFLELVAGHIGNAIASANSQRTEKALKVSEERFKSLVESDVVGIFVGDTSGAINEANDELLRIVGYTREDLRQGKLRWTDITPPEYFASDNAAQAQAPANRLLYALRKKVYSQRWRSDTCASGLYSDGREHIRGSGVCARCERSQKDRRSARAAGKGASACHRHRTCLHFVC